MKYIPVIIQNARFALLIYAPTLLKKIRNRAGLYSLFSAAQTQKSSRAKTRILKDHGYKNILLICSLLLTSKLWAFSCYITAMKDNCWTNFNVTISVIDVNSKKSLTEVIIPSGKSWERASFSCEPAQILKFEAKFTPIIWDSDKDKIYYSYGSRVLKSEIDPTDTAWNINLCFASEFAEVPLSPDATGNCKCDPSVLPKF